MFAKAIPILAVLVTTIPPLAAEPAAAHRCKVAPTGAAAQTSASICVPLELHPHGRSTVYLNQGPGSLGDIVGGRDGHARELARLASYSANGDWTQVDIRSRELSEFGVSDEDIETAIAQTGPRRHPSGPPGPHVSSVRAGGS
jgi:hypothetical protein